MSIFIYIKNADSSEHTFSFSFFSDQAEYRPFQIITVYNKCSKFMLDCGCVIQAPNKEEGGAA
jgi:hypothetical protein